MNEDNILIIIICLMEQIDTMCEKLLIYIDYALHMGYQLPAEAMVYYQAAHIALENEDN